MNFSLLPPVLDARLNGALSRARGRILAAEVVAEQVRAEAREKASRCDERLGLEILEDYLAEAKRHVQEQQEQAACELFSELIALRLAAGDNPAEVARDLKRGLPGSIREEIEAVVPLTPSTLSVLGVAIEVQCQKCWEQVERNGPVPVPAITGVLTRSKFARSLRILTPSSQKASTNASHLGTSSPMLWTAIRTSPPGESWCSIFDIG